ncbi:hypothetical protein D3C72_1024310 [compost metagenome]
MVSSTTSAFSFSVDFTLSTILIPPPVVSTGLLTEESAGFSAGICAAIIGAGAMYPAGTFKTIPSFTPSDRDGFNATNSSCDK